MSLLVFEFGMKNVMAKLSCVIYFEILHSALNVNYAVNFIIFELENSLDLYSRFLLSSISDIQGKFACLLAGTNFRSVAAITSACILLIRSISCPSFTQPCCIFVHSTLHTMI